MPLCLWTSIYNSKRSYRGAVNKVLSCVSGELALSPALLVTPVWPWAKSLVYPVSSYVNKGFIHPTLKKCTDFLLSESQMLGPQQDPSSQSPYVNALPSQGQEKQWEERANKQKQTHQRAVSDTKSWNGASLPHGMIWNWVVCQPLWGYDI